VIRRDWAQARLIVAGTVLLPNCSQDRALAFGRSAGCNGIYRRGEACTATSRPLRRLKDPPSGRRTSLGEPQAPCFLFLPHDSSDGNIFACAFSSQILNRSVSSAQIRKSKRNVFNADF